MVRRKVGELKQALLRVTFLSLHLKCFLVLAFEV